MDWMRRELRAEPHRTLLDVLRADLGLTGTKENCLEAECGVCTVLLDGLTVNACILLAAQFRGRSIVTIEGLAAPGEMHPLQRAWPGSGARVVYRARRPGVPSCRETPCTR